MSLHFSHLPCLDFTGMARPSVTMLCCDYSVKDSMFPLLCPLASMTPFPSYLLALSRLLSNSHYESAAVFLRALVLRCAL